MHVIPNKRYCGDFMLKRIRAAYGAFKEPNRFFSKTAKELIKQMDSQYTEEPGRWLRVKQMTEKALADAALSGGVMLEIGGRKNPRNLDFPSFEYHALDLFEATSPDFKVIVGDITNCPEIPDGSYDFIFSFDVFEHVDKPWLAGAEISRLLKPGGVTVHSTLFSWRYHPCPIDYWRYSPEGLASLFPDLETLHCGFDYVERRRNVIGQGRIKAPMDELGGWRENVRVNFAGRKPA